LYGTIIVMSRKINFRSRKCT